MDDLKQRLEDLEKRVARLEADATPHGQLDRGDQPAKADSSPLFQVRITNKRYQPQDSNLGNYQDMVWYDCSYLPEKLAKATRAIKGIMEFADLFGEVKFQLMVTLNERLEPGRLFKQQGVGFEYNQFKDDHQWMLVTKEANMKVGYKVTNILYEDGTMEAFA